MAGDELGFFVFGGNTVWYGSGTPEVRRYVYSTGTWESLPDAPVALIEACMVR